MVVRRTVVQAVLLALTAVLLTAGSAQAAAPSNGWYGYIYTEYEFDRTQVGPFSTSHLNQRDTVRTVFRGALDQMIFGAFRSDETNEFPHTCGTSGIVSDRWSVEVSASAQEAPDTAAAVFSPSGSSDLAPGAADDYTLRQGFERAPFNGLLVSWANCALHEDTTSGLGSIGANQVRTGDNGDSIQGIPVAAGWDTLAGTKFLANHTVDNEGSVTGATNVTTRWEWSLTREPDLDYDGIPDSRDNCPPQEVGDPGAFNPGQGDSDGDGVGDVCEETRIVVVKNALPSDTGKVFQFTGALTGSISHGGSLTALVEPGVHMVSETATGGWVVESIVCDDDDSRGSGNTATFSVQPGETVRCTFNNRGQLDCLSDAGNRVFVNPGYSARIQLALLPDAQLYQFFPSARFCWDGVRAVVETASGTGTADSGFDEAPLEALGFTTGYDPDDSYVDNRGSSVVVVGDFDIAWNSLVLIDKLGVRTRVERFAEQRVREAIERALRRYGYGPGTARVIIDELAFLQGDTVRQINNALKDMVEVLPGGRLRELGSQIRDAVVDRVDAALTAIRAPILILVEPGADWTASEMAGFIVEQTFGALEDLATFEFEVWTPEWVLTPSPNGTYSIGLGGEVNPLLLVSPIG